MALAVYIREMPKVHVLLPQSISRDSVLSLTDITSLPDTDVSGLFPTPFLSVFHREFDHFKRNAEARRALVTSIEHQNADQISAVTFILAMRSFLRWPGSEEQEASELQLNAIIRRCERRAERRGLKSYREKSRLNALRKLLRRQTVARWQAYITYGFALLCSPDKPTPRVLEDFRDALTLNAYGIDPRRVRLHNVRAPSFDSIRSNVFRFLAEDKDGMTELSQRHFRALRRQLDRGLIPFSHRFKNWK